METAAPCLLKSLSLHCASQSACNACLQAVLQPTASKHAWQHQRGCSTPSPDLQQRRFLRPASGARERAMPPKGVAQVVGHLMVPHPASELASWLPVPGAGHCTFAATPEHGHLAEWSQVLALLSCRRPLLCTAQARPAHNSPVSPLARWLHPRRLPRPHPMESVWGDPADGTGERLGYCLQAYMARKARASTAWTQPPLHSRLGHLHLCVRHFVHAVHVRPHGPRHHR